MHNQLSGLHAGMHEGATNRVSQQAADCRGGEPKDNGCNNDEAAEEIDEHEAWKRKKSREDGERGSQEVSG
jgi:hypothetical protein